MILVFDDVNVREKFEKELSEAVVYHRLDSEVFGDGVSHEDYVNRMFIGASIPFYKEVFRKNVAKRALENEYVILDCDPNIPDGVEKCPVIYITDRTEGNDEEYGQLPVKYLGTIEDTIKQAKDTISQWLSKYAEDHTEQYFYQNFYDVSAARVPEKIRLVAVERIQSEYVAQVNVDFDDENIEDIMKCIELVEKETGCKIFIDEDIDRHFNIEDYYYSILYADDMESFIELARSLEEKNNTLIRDLGCVRNAIEENLENWKQIIYHEIFLKHNVKDHDYVKIPAGYFQIYYESAYVELRLEKLVIEVEEDDVVFLNKVIRFLEKELSSLGGTVKIQMYFYGHENLEEMLDKSK